MSDPPGRFRLNTILLLVENGEIRGVLLSYYDAMIKKYARQWVEAMNFEL